MTASFSPGWDPLISPRCPGWRLVVAAGRGAWWVDSGQLLDSPRLITPDTLLVVTSQSGASGEVAALLDPGGDQPLVPRAVVGITNDNGSPLGAVLGCRHRAAQRVRGDCQHQELPQ